MTDEEMQGFMERVGTLEAEMAASGTFVFSARLHGRRYGDRRPHE